MDNMYSSPSSFGGNVTDYYGDDSSMRSAGRGFLFIFIMILLIAIIVTFVLWMVWYRPLGVGFGEFIVMALKTVANILLWPFKFILQVLGIWPSSVVSAINNGQDILGDLGIPSAQVIRHNVSDCPPCTNECVCPKCDEIDIRPYELEIKYLKDMVKMTGSIARRENAINSQYRELYPGFSVISPHVRKLSHEYNFIKNEIRKDPEEWQYFKNYYSRISGIPSSSQEVQYDLVL